MNPYLRAFEAYQAADRGVSWTDALDFHFQRGAVISLPDLFVMVRRVRLDWEDDLHTMLGPVADAGDAWHVWAVAGDLRGMLDLAARHDVRWLTYQRHGQDRLRRVEFVRLFNIREARPAIICQHEVAKNAETTATATATRAGTRQGS